MESEKATDKTRQKDVHDEALAELETSHRLQMAKVSFIPRLLWIEVLPLHRNIY